MALTGHSKTCSAKTSLNVPYNADNAAQGHTPVVCVDHKHMHRAHWPELKVSLTAQALLNLPTTLLALAFSSSLLTNTALLTGP